MAELGTSAGCRGEAKALGVPNQAAIATRQAQYCRSSYWRPGDHKVMPLREKQIFKRHFGLSSPKQQAERLMGSFTQLAGLLAD